MRHPTKNRDHTMECSDGSKLSVLYDIHESQLFKAHPVFPLIEEAFRLASDRFLSTRQPQNAMIDFRKDPAPELPACLFIYVGQPDDFENGTVFSLASRKNSVASECLTMIAANHFRKMSDSEEVALMLRFRASSGKERRRILAEAEDVIRKHRAKP